MQQALAVVFLACDFENLYYRGASLSANNNYMAEEHLKAEQIADSFINGNLSWVKEQLQADVKMVSLVLSILPRLERDRMFNWITTW